MLISNLENIASTKDLIGNSLIFDFLIIIAINTYKHFEVKR